LVNLNTLYDDMVNSGIKLYNTFECVDACVLEVRNGYGIFVNFFACGNIADMQYMLMHEYGHCATGCTHKVGSKYDLVEKHEYKANKFAMLRYLPPCEFEEAFANGYTQPWELSEWFNIPEKFIIKTLGYYKENNLIKGELL
jgi:hypothetical protein